MGDLLAFPIDRTCRSRPRPAVATPPVFLFDVGDPLSYLAAERVERTLGPVEWVPADGSAIGERGGSSRRLRAEAEARARTMRLPLVWPERMPGRASGARRASALACELGSGSAFALALSRLAFCGGFDIEDPETLAEAAAAAAVPLGACLAAARETWRDETLTESTRAAHEQGVPSLPAFRVDGVWFHGEAGMAQAGARMIDRSREPHPLAPVG